MSVGTVVRVGIIYEEKQLDLQSPSSSVVPLRQTREFSLLRDLPHGAAQFVAPLESEPPPYWRSLWCNSDGFFYTISLKETTVAHRTFTTPDYMLCVSCLIILFLSQGWVMFSHLLFQCLAYYKAEILKGDFDPSVEDWMMTSKREVSMPSFESLWGCQEIQMEDLNWGASQSSQLQPQARVQFKMLGRCLGLSQKCPNPGHKTKLGE